MRPRSDANNTLPKNVYHKHGSFYLVKAGRWIWLTKDRNQVESAMQRLVQIVPSRMEEVRDYAFKLLARSRSNARNRRHGTGMEHSLTQADILEMLHKSQWSCSVTRVPFSMQVVGPKGQRPFAPSIDRIDNAHGYVRTNCRMVCVVANIAMNTWGAEALLAMIQHGRASNRLDI